MPEGKGRGRGGKRPRAGEREKRRAGLPDPSSVVQVTTFISPKGRLYSVIRTTEKDPYDDGGSDEKKR